MLVILPNRTALTKNEACDFYRLTAQMLRLIYKLTFKLRCLQNSNKRGKLFCASAAEYK